MPKQPDNVITFDSAARTGADTAPQPAAKLASAADVTNRSRLLQAATESFAEHGYEGTSLRTIADSAGVSFQLITYYFGAKEELWVSTVDYLFERYLETGKGLGFTVSGNLYEQFRNHLRLLLTDMLQRPHLRNIWIQEYLANSERYAHVIRPKIKHLYDNLSAPYFKEVVRLGIVKKFSAEELMVLYSAIIQNNVVYPYYIELALGLPAGSAKSIERQVDLIFAIFTAEPDAQPNVRAEPPATAAPPAVEGGAAWEKTREASAEQTQVKRLEAENLSLKQIVGTLSLEKKALLELLAKKEKT